MHAQAITLAVLSGAAAYHYYEKSSGNSKQQENWKIYGTLILYIELTSGFLLDMLLFVSCVICLRLINLVVATTDNDDKYCRSYVM